jgi:hypothetical protein
MLTWAIVALMGVVKEIPCGLLLVAMAGDVAIVFFGACACRGWPRDREEGGEG